MCDYLQPASPADEHVNEECVQLDLVVDDEQQDSLCNHTISPAVAKQPKCTVKRLKHDASDSSGSDLDSDVLFGQFIAAELHAITDPMKKRYTKLQIHNIINTALSEC